MISDAAAWHEANQRYLSFALAEIKERLKHLVADKEGDDRNETDEVGEKTEAKMAIIRSSMQSPPSLDIVCRSFGLSGFERDLLLLCAGVELDSGFASLLAQFAGGIPHSYATFGLALAVLENAHWSALSPASPLRRWRLIEVDEGRTLTSSPIKIEERVLHYLA
ncbi:MAG: hypothetical protein QG575_2075, partial [Euryarchaeota archaeon]|nr:hypothetical protein [Euryarchaeota archaeon]